MGISVISTSAGSVSNVASTSLASGTEGLPGGFAALLFSELENLVSTLPEDASKAIASASLEKEAKSLATEASDGTTAQVDPALIAALTGNLSPPPEIAPLKIAAPDTNTDKSLSDKGLLSSVRLAALSERESSDVKTSTAVESSASKILEKFTLPGNSQTGNASPRNEAANIAVETLPVATDKPTASQPVDFAALAQTTSKAAEIAPPAQANIRTHLQESAWPQHFSEKVVWLAKSDQQSAQININPPQLGPVQITLNLSGDQASMTFASPHAEVRQAIENALPHLKEMLLATGINLGQANVGANLAQQQNPDTPAQNSNGKRLADENAILPANDKVASTGASSALHRGRGLVDLFA